MTAPGGGAPLTGGEGTPQHAAPLTRVSEKGKASGAEAMARSWWGTRGPAPGAVRGDGNSGSCLRRRPRGVVHCQKSFYGTPGEGGFIVNYTSTNLTFPRKEEEKDDNQT